jgi:hypothetical protein
MSIVHNDCDLRSRSGRQCPRNRRIAGEHRDRSASHGRAATRCLGGRAHPRVGGSPPGGGSPARLPRLVGRGRALEILAGAEDFDGDLAERYGYVNRAIPDGELDAFVTAFAGRVATFDSATLGEMKGWVDAITLPYDGEFPPQSDAFAARLGGPRFQDWAQGAFTAGLQQTGDLEERLGTRSVEFQGVPDGMP